MREIRTSGSEGGGGGTLTAPSYPYQLLLKFRSRILVLTSSGQCSGKRLRVAATASRLLGAAAERSG